MSGKVFSLGHFASAQDSFVGVVTGSTVTPLASLARAVTAPELAVGSVDALLHDWGGSFDAIARALDALGDGLAELSVGDIQGLRPLPPVANPGKRLYAAANYRDHVAGMRKTFTSALPDVVEKPAAKLMPYMFVKACEQTGACDDIILPPGLPRTDWEAELVVVIGAAGKNIPPERVGDHIAGYMSTNDVSCRDLTWREDRPAIRSDWLSGKSFDSFSPMGPFFTPKAFVPDHAALSIRLWVNGVLKQDGRSGDMIFGIEDQIAYASRMMKLLPGDLFATGTSAGTGQERLEFLKDGDVVEIEIEHCGRQRNRVVAGSSDYGREA